MGFPCEHITADRLVHCSVAISVVETVLYGVKAALVTWKQILHTIQSFCNGTTSTSVTAFHYCWGFSSSVLTLEKFFSCSIKCSYRRAPSDSVPQGAVDYDPPLKQKSQGWASFQATDQLNTVNSTLGSKVSSEPSSGSGPGCSAPKGMSLFNESLLI